MRPGITEALEAIAEELEGISDEVFDNILNDSDSSTENGSDD
ncbi:hypothetical protein P3626_23740 [Vibrio parahaemolyticus]|nr:hypothetical protein [Vibrio parahaemolyticus]MDF4886008.1 hypothetical protein [Vibrio parahaemolyticus]MDF5326642.1 hypothetical protein [Vibrio parahaemolyticus]